MAYSVSIQRSIEFWLCLGAVDKSLVLIVGYHIAPRKAKALSFSLSGRNRVESGGPFYIHCAVQLDSVPSRGIYTTRLGKGSS